MVHCAGNRSEMTSRIRLGLLVLSLLVLMTGCSSRQHTRVNSLSPDNETTIAQLEETSIEAPLPILPVPTPETERSRQPDGQPQTIQPVEPGNTNDVYDSSGEATQEEPMASILESVPISELAKPDDLEDIPYTLSDVFFDYDQYTLRADDLIALQTNAKILLGHYPNKKLIIQGHCDERGTEEYNLALGVRRAQAVKDYLADLGVPPENMDVLSYGKTKPFCSQHSLTCWQHNRRSHFVFE
ncbi:MAG: hypothetical protein NPIRA01_21150 [Nitrospirales bacterium]|nr:MAG: hypothetical protein NPIRA01_21150 [Nitrospirales bacterium]